MLMGGRWLLSAVAVASAVDLSVYTEVGAGPCRGNGGSTDKVNSRSMAGLSTALCEQACEAIPEDGSDGICAGFASQTSGAMDCILYGPGMSGSCAPPNDDVIFQDECIAIGTCDDPTTATSENGCGSCSDPSAVVADACESASATWSAGVWTTTGVWEGPEGAWTGEFYHTDHIHIFDTNSHYICYDKDITDHIGKCSDGTDTPSGTDCVTAFAAAATYEEDSCSTGEPDNCIWTAAPSAPAPKPAHPSVDTMDGYNTFSGACRSTSPANKEDPTALPLQDRPPYMYKMNTEFPDFPTGTSPAELAVICDTINSMHEADPVTNFATCLGFHSGPWMSLFGLKMNEAGPHLELDEGWSVWDEGSGTLTLEGTKPNHQYLCLINLNPPMPDGWWYYNDGYMRSWSGDLAVSAKPKVVCHIDVCESLWVMGVREDQIVGYFYGSPSSWAGMCEGVHCKSAHYELIPDVSDGGTYGLDMDKIDALAPDMIVDVAYCGMASNADSDLEACYAENACELHSFKYANYGTTGRTSEETCSMLTDKGVPYITINVMQGYIEAVDSVQRLAITLGDPPNPDTVNHCHDFHDAMTMMQATAQQMQEKGLRVTTMYLGGSNIYAAQPTDDPILMMLEELGVPMTHVTVTDDRGHYWEKYDFNSSVLVGQQTNSIREGGGPIWDTDVWMYDTRTHDTHFGADAVPLVEQFNNPAWIAGQIAPWPIGSAVGFSYEAGTRVLNMLRAVFDKAERIEPAGTCTDVDVSLRSRMEGGEFACYGPKPMLPSCPVAVGSANTVPDWQVEATAAGWIPCAGKAAARKRKLAILEDKGARPGIVKKVLDKLGFDDDVLELKTKAEKKRQTSRRLSQKVASKVAADDDDEL